MFHGPPHMGAVLSLQDLGTLRAGGGAAHRPGGPAQSYARDLSARESKCSGQRPRGRAPDSQHPECEKLLVIADQDDNKITNLAQISQGPVPAGPSAQERCP